MAPEVESVILEVESVILEVESVAPGLEFVLQRWSRDHQKDSSPVSQEAVEAGGVLLHPHVCAAGAVVGPPEDLCHVLQHIQDGQQVSAVAGPIAGCHLQLGHHLRHAVSNQASLRLGQVFPCLREDVASLTEES